MRRLYRRSFPGLLATLIVVSLAGIAGSNGIEDQALDQNLSDAPSPQFYGGWRPDQPRFVRPLARPSPLVQTLPPEKDLRTDLGARMPPIYDQGKIQACTANALAALVAIKLSHFEPSRLFIHYNARVRIAGDDADIDSYVSCENAVSALNLWGVCPETDWLYDGRPAYPCSPHSKISCFPQGHRAAIKPRDNAYHDATPQIMGWDSLDKPGDLLQNLKKTLADGEPFMFGLTIYSSFYDPSYPPGTRPLTFIPMPRIPPEKAVKRHCVVAVGYVDNVHNPQKGFFICRNSWGTVDSQGNPVQADGYFYLPYGYLKYSEAFYKVWLYKPMPKDLETLW
jgi:C1A family cysteine protease